MRAVPKTKYENRNPKAMDAEKRFGEFLHDKAQSGELSGVERVVGWPEGKTRSGDYRFYMEDGSVIGNFLTLRDEGNVLRDLDQTLRQLLVQRGNLDSGEVEIAFEAPTRDWAAKRGNNPTLNLYLYDVRENRQLRETDWVTTRSRRLGRGRGEGIA